MRLLGLAVITREVHYQGFKLEIPEWCNYAATDSTGVIYAYEYKPVIKQDVWVESEPTDSACYVGVVALDTADEWVSSCLEV